MRNLTKWQTISFMSRGFAMAVGIVQSFVIVRILTVSQWGVVQIAASIGGAFGIYQHLGLASGSTREISSAKDDTEIFKIFITSVFIRYLITLPLAVFLFLSARNLAVNKYLDPTLILPLKIYALVLLIQGFQSIFNSVISGTQRFRHLFLYQAGISLISAILYIPLVYFYKVNGYFYSLVIFNLISSVVLGVLAFKPLKAKFSWPSRNDFKYLLKDLLSISLAIYVVKIIYTMWEKSGPILLGLTVSKEMVGIFAFALLYAKKILNISDAATDVSLPVFSESYVKNIQNFKKEFSKNFNRLFVIIIFSSMSAVFWSKEVIRIAVGNTKYDASLVLVLPLIYAFGFYSFINIVKSSVSIPAKMIKSMFFSYFSLLIITVGLFYILIMYTNKLLAMSYGMSIGAFIGLVLIVYMTQKTLRFNYVNKDHILILVQSLAISLNQFIDNLRVKIILYIIFVILYFWAIYVCKFIDDNDIKKLKQKTAYLLRLRI